MKPFSYAAFVAYGNACINNANGKTQELQDAFRADLKKNIAKAGYPSKDEIGIIDTINDFEMTATLKAIPSMVTGFIKDEDRSFELPAVNDSTAAGSLYIDSVDEHTRTGVIQFGERKGETYESTTAAHDEYKVHSNTKPFKQ
jgi:hypothetical protein